MEPCSEKVSIELLKAGSKRREEKLDRIITILEGNGREGLVTKVAVHRTWFKMAAAIGGPIIIFLTARAVWALFIK